MEKPRFQFTIRNMLWATFWAAVGTSFVGLALSSLYLIVWGMVSERAVALPPLPPFALDFLAAVTWSFVQTCLGVMFIAWVAQAAWRWWRRRTAPDRPEPSISILAVLAMMLIVAIANVVELMIRQQVP